MKKIIIALMLCLALVMTVLTGCGGEEKKPAENNAVETNAENETADEANNGEAEATGENTENNTQDNAEESVEEPKLAEDIAVNPEKAEDVVNTLEFDNVNLLSSIANAMGKATSEVTQEDIESIYYFSIGTETTGDYTVYIGMQNYKNAVDEGLDDLYVQQFVKKSVMEIDVETDSLTDIVKFKNLETFELYNVPVADVSFIKELGNLAYGYFRDNGITDISALEGYDSDKLMMLDFTENNITDWTPVYHIKEKIKVDNGYRIMNDENSEPVYIKVSEPIYLEDKIATDEAKAAAGESGDSSQLGLVDQNQNPVDFSSLFE